MQTKSKKYHLHFLDRSSIVINNIRFIGCTLWTDINENANLKGRTDFKIIRVESYSNKKLHDACNSKKDNIKKLRLSTTIMRNWNKTERHFIDTELQLASKNKENAIILTHFAPTLNKTINKEYIQKIVYENGSTIHNYAKNFSGNDNLIESITSSMKDENILLMWVDF